MNSYFIDKHHALLAAGYIAPLGGALVLVLITIYMIERIFYIIMIDHDDFTLRLWNFFFLDLINKLKWFINVLVLY